MWRIFRFLTLLNILLKLYFLIFNFLDIDINPSWLTENYLDTDEDEASIIKDNSTERSQADVDSEDSTSEETQGTIL